MNGTNGAQPTAEAVLKKQAKVIVDYQDLLMRHLRAGGAPQEVVADIMNASVATFGALCPGISQHVMDELKERMDPATRARAVELEQRVDRAMGLIVRM